MRECICLPLYHFSHKNQSRIHRKISLISLGLIDLTNTYIYAMLNHSSTNKRSVAMQLRMEMSQREKIIWTIVITLIVGLWIEFTYQPFGIAADIGEFAMNRISGHQVKHTASVTPKTTVAKVRNVKSSPSTSGNYAVQPGETLYAINRKYDGKVDIKATCALNALGPECKTTAGQSINLALRQ